MITAANCKAGATNELVPAAAGCVPDNVLCHSKSEHPRLQGATLWHLGISGQGGTPPYMAECPYGTWVTHHHPRLRPEPPPETRTPSLEAPAKPLPGVIYESGPSRVPKTHREEELLPRTWA